MKQLPLGSFAHQKLLIQAAVERHRAINAVLAVTEPSEQQKEFKLIENLSTEEIWHRYERLVRGE